MSHKSVTRDSDVSREDQLFKQGPHVSGGVSRGRCECVRGPWVGGDRAGECGGRGRAGEEKREMAVLEDGKIIKRKKKKLYKK